jgi:3-hydroxyisobutyrate dehydrogenase
VQAPTRVGFVGLGRMGQPMAARLRRAGVAVTVFDTRADAVHTFVAQHGGTAAPSLRALAERSEVIITMLPDGEVVRRVVLGDADPPGDRLLDGIRRGAVLIDMSSSSPTGTQTLGRELAAHGIDMLDAPVSGGVARAERGTLSVMVGGAPQVVARCRPLFEPLAEHLFETGTLGSGHALKALNNLVSAAGLIAAAEALLIGRRFGLDPVMMIDVFNASTARNNSTENKFKQCILSRTFASGFSLDLMVKDLSTALAVADATHTPAPFSAACRELWATAQAQLEAGADHTAVVRWLERLASTTLTFEEG